MLPIDTVCTKPYVWLLHSQNSVNVHWGATRLPVTGQTITKSYCEHCCVAKSSLQNYYNSSLFWSQRALSAFQAKTCFKPWGKTVPTPRALCSGMNNYHKTIFTFSQCSSNAILCIMSWQMLVWSLFFIKTCLLRQCWVHIGNDDTL